MLNQKLYCRFYALFVDMGWGMCFWQMSEKRNLVHTRDYLLSAQDKPERSKVIHWHFYYNLR